MATALGKVCNACKVERKKKGIMYDTKEFMPYCENPYICNDDHPNSPRNLIERGSELKLVTFEEAQEMFQKWLSMNHPDPEISNKIRRMVKNPTTVRIGNPELAQFILETQTSLGFSSIADTIRYCVELVKNNKDRWYADYRELKLEKEEKERVEETEKEVQQSISTPVLPKEEEKPEEKEETPVISDDELVF